MTDQLRVNGNLVDSLGNATRHGGSALGTVPRLLRRVLEEHAWREFVTQRGEHVHHDRFADFVTTPPLKGLGATMELIHRVVKGDPDLESMLDQVEQRPRGTNQHSAEHVDNVNKLARPAGNSGAAALRRLRKDAPELHAQVLTGKLTPHAAMIQAGFRPRMVSVNMDDPQSGANTVRRNASPEYLAEFRRLLNKEE